MNICCAKTATAPYSVILLFAAIAPFVAQLRQAQAVVLGSQCFPWIGALAALETGLSCYVKIGIPLQCFGICY